VKRVPPLILAACCAILLGGTPLGAADGGAEIEFVPEPSPAAQEQLVGTMWVLETPECTIRLQRIGEQDRRTYIERVTGSETDPFASPPDQRPGYLTFLAEVENHAKSDLIVQPATWWLVTDKKEIINPIGIEDLMATYEALGQQMAPVYERARPAVLAQSKVVEPGGSVSGLLIYRNLKNLKAKRFSVDALLTAPDGTLLRLHATYRRVKKDKS
jgi:hypothetical protein